MARADGDETRAERATRNDISGEVAGPAIQAGSIGHLHVTVTGSSSPAGSGPEKPAEGSGRPAGTRRWRRGGSARKAITGMGGGKPRRLVVSAIGVAVLSAIGGALAFQPQIRGLVSGTASGPDFAASVEAVRLDDEGWWAATSGDFRPTSAQSRFLAEPMSTTSEKYDDFLGSTGAVNVGEQTLRLTLTGRRDQQVNVLDVRPVIVRRASPLAGTLFAVGSQAGSATFQVIYDLDRPNPVARKAVRDTDFSESNPDAGAVRPGPPFFADTTITLRRDEQNVLVLRARTERFHVAFRLKVTYMLGDRRKYMIVDDHGRPFQVSGVSRSPDGEERYGRVFSMQSDYSMCQTVGPDVDAARQCQGI
ncbi:hypothetical protein GCM10012286_21710 [Streptomyces lasiicapitis]|uniref:Uncharacterized protein n=2 Tax=Streptomyces lasiicapitis TaxID=1923961 RepID=A0ABQ2LQE7_9ACTN|nr:hypothetical protein [Streptomyces aureoverticillatus]QIB47444.1 hypothetical protein G3H79_34555 [Streptomyces aureoverticillatus]GGO41630.1 hypothetical protein GCM10012286_21710 [Streptomyces lasiicapitis]